MINFLRFRGFVVFCQTKVWGGGGGEVGGGGFGKLKGWVFSVGFRGLLLLS